MAGRKPKPTKLKLITGNPGKRPLNEREPQPKPGIPECPGHLDEEARAEWVRIVPELCGMGVLARTDRAALAAYCQTWSRWVKAELLIQEHGMIVQVYDRERQPSTTKISPAVNISNKMLSQMLSFITEFGLTPASRSRIVVGGHDGLGGDEAEKYFKRS